MKTIKKYILAIIPILILPFILIACSPSSGSGTAQSGANPHFTNAIVADAGSDQRTFGGNRITLDAGKNTRLGSCADQSTPEFSWQQIKGTAVLAGVDTQKQTLEFTTDTLTTTEQLTFEIKVGEETQEAQSQGCFDKDGVNLLVIVANAGPARSVKDGEIVALDGSLSNVDGLENLQFTWRQTNIKDTTVEIDNPNQLKTSFRAPKLNTPETLQFELLISDPTLSGNSRATVDITIEESENQPPIADAGTDQSVTTNSSVILDGDNSSDPDGNIVRYAWSQLSGTAVDLSDNSIPKPQFLAPSTPITLVFELEVADNRGKTATDQVQITVTEKNIPNQAPIADAGEKQSVTSGTRVTLDGSQSRDPDSGDEIVSFEWEQISGSPAVTLSDTTISQPQFVAPIVSTETTLVFQLEVTDQAGAQARDNVEVIITSEPQAPIANAGEDQSVLEGDTVPLNGTASRDPDGNIVSYQWSVDQNTTGLPVSLENADSAQASFTAPTLNSDESSATLRFKLTVTDNDGLTNEDTIEVTISDSNRPPIAVDDQRTISSNTSFLMFRYEVLENDTDPDGDTISIISIDEFTQNNVKLNIIEINSEIEYTPPNNFVGQDSFNYTITDGNGGTDTAQVAITVENQPPIARATADRDTVYLGEIILLDGSGSTEPENQSLTYSWEQISESLSGIDIRTPEQEQTRVFMPTGIGAPLGTTYEVEFRLTVTDSYNESDSATVVISFINNFPSVGNKPLRLDNKDYSSTYAKLLTNKNIHDLYELNLSNKKITNLSPLKNLNNLERLYLDRNQINNLEHLSILDNLKILSLANNKIEDLSPLSNLSNLKQLNLNGNQIKNIEALSSLNQLEYLYLQGNEIIDLSPLANLNNLKILDISENKTHQLTALMPLSQLKRFHFWENYVADISPLAGLINLQTINAYQNCITDFSVLNSATDLRGALYQRSTQDCMVTQE